VLDKPDGGTGLKVHPKFVFPSGRFGAIFH
jgi:hypothetical protein